jgi:hypothetical protein
VEKSDLADKVLVLFDEFLASSLWQQAFAHFKEHGFGKFTKGNRTINLFSKFLRPEIVDRAILEAKDAAYRYCKDNPEKAREFFELLHAKLTELLA